MQLKERDIAPLHVVDVTLNITLSVTLSVKLNVTLNVSLNDHQIIMKYRTS